MPTVREEPLGVGGRQRAGEQSTLGEVAALRTQFAGLRSKRQSGRHDLEFEGVPQVEDPPARRGV